MNDQGKRVLDLAPFPSWTQDQLQSDHFPFRNLRDEDTLGWLESHSVTGENMWLPAQMVLVGYNARHDLGEPWLLPAVTTGTAAHTDPIAALKSALLEIVLLDAAMGHWFSNLQPTQIVPDRRTSVLSDIISQSFAGSEFAPSFFWLPSPDLFGTCVACLLECKGNSTPAIAVGLGSDWNLELAMYKALVEGVGVLQLAKLVSLSTRDINIDKISDLDSNVAWYGAPEHAGIVRDKFLGPKVEAHNLAPDFSGSEIEGLERMVRSFTETGKRLFLYDFTTLDIEQLGFCAVRAFSPDTLSLCLPSFPQKANRRFDAYGGFSNAQPHPFP
jgi:thiazole/oxazole-forming peptide maturase SagD family component